MQRPTDSAISLAILTSIVFWLAACAVHAPPKRASAPVCSTLDLPMDEATQMLRKQLSAEGFSLRSENGKSGKIDTEFREQRLTDEQADCGTYFGMSALKYGNRATTDASYSVSLTSVDEKHTKVCIQMTGRGTFNDWYGPQIQLSCISKGILERSLFEGVEKQRRMTAWTSLSKKRKNQTIRDACREAQSAVRNRLKAPSTAEFPSCTFSLPGDNTVSTTDEPFVFMVQGHVDAQNGFGAMIRTRYKVMLRAVPPSTGGESQWVVLGVEID